MRVALLDAYWILSRHRYLYTSRMIKDKKHSIMNRIYSAMRTGLTMAFTTITVVFITLILVQSDVVKQIVLILFIGLLVDLIMTWLQNAILIRLWLEGKNENISYKSYSIIGMFINCNHCTCRL